MKMTKYRDGEKHKCDASCGHVPSGKKTKRVMGQSKPVSTTVTIPTAVTITAEEPTWQNVAEGVITKQIQNYQLEGITKAFSSISKSDNTDAHKEADLILRECERKLNNLKRDKQIE